MKETIRKKKLGIIGGMGPLATAIFFKELVERTKVKKDWEHLHILIDNNIAIPSRTRAILYDEESPVEAIRQSAHALQEQGCEFLAIPCNQAHYFYEEVTQGQSIPWVNMLEVVSEEVNSYRNVLVLGGYVTTQKKIYDRYLSNTLYLNEADNQVMINLIEKLKLNENHEGEKEKLLDCIRKRYANADCLLLACSELPLAFEEGSLESFQVVSSTRIYIDALIRIGFGNESKKRKAAVHL